AVRLSQPQPTTITVAAFVDEDEGRAAYRSDTLNSSTSVSEAYARAIRATTAQGVQFAVTSEGGIVTRREWRATILSPLKVLAQQAGVQIIVVVTERAPP